MLGSILKEINVQELYVQRRPTPFFLRRDKFPKNSIKSELYSTNTLSDFNENEIAKLQMIKMVFGIEAGLFYLNYENDDNAFKEYFYQSFARIKETSRLLKVNTFLENYHRSLMHLLELIEQNKVLSMMECFELHCIHIKLANRAIYLAIHPDLRLEFVSDYLLTIKDFIKNEFIPNNGIRPQEPTPPREEPEEIEEVPLQITYTKMQPRLIILDKLGILNHIENNILKDINNKTNLAEVVAAITGFSAENIRKTLYPNVFNNPDHKNSPYKNKKNEPIADNELAKLSLKIKLNKKYP